MISQLSVSTYAPVSLPTPPIQPLPTSLPESFSLLPKSIQEVAYKSKEIIFLNNELEKLAKEIPVLKCSINSLKRHQFVEWNEIFLGHEACVASIGDRIRILYNYLNTVQPQDAYTENDFIKTYNFVQGNIQFQLNLGSIKARKFCFKVVGDYLQYHNEATFPYYQKKFTVQPQEVSSEMQAEVILSYSSSEFVLSEYLIQKTESLSLRSLVIRRSHQALLNEKRALTDKHVLDVWKLEDKIRAALYMPILYKFKNLQRRNEQILKKYANAYPENIPNYGYWQEIKKINFLAEPIINFLAELTAPNLKCPLDGIRLKWDRAYEDSFLIQDEITEKIDFLIIKYKPFASPSLVGLLEQIKILCKERKGLAFGDYLENHSEQFKALKKVFASHIFIPARESLGDIVEICKVMRKIDYTDQNRLQATITMAEEVIEVCHPMLHQIDDYLETLKEEMSQ